MDVHGVMHDFEWAMINLIERWFKCDYHLGCFFIGSRQSVTI